MMLESHQHQSYSIDQDEEVDYNKLARLELMKLQRQYRLMEITQHSAADESGTTISRQYGMLRFLRNEKDNLETDLKNVASIPNKRTDENNRKHMTDLMNKYEKYQDEIKMALEEIQEIEQQVDKITQKVVDQNLKIISLFGQSRTPDMAQKKLSTLENRLYHKTTLYDTLVAKNKELRAEINLILMERARYHKRTMFIKRSIRRIKAKMTDIVDYATAMYEARDESSMKVKAIREKDEKDTKLHINELKELLRLQHNDEKNHLFMMIKCGRRDEYEGETARKVRHDQRKESELDIMIYTYKRSFKEILKLGLSSDVDTLCHQYHEQEQQNFSWFKNTCEVNNEIESLREAVKLIKEEIEEIKRGQDKDEEISEDILKEKQRFAEDLEEALDDVENSLEMTKSDLDTYLNEFLSIYHMMGCEDAFTDLLGNQKGVRPDIFPICFRVLEHKLDELSRQFLAYQLRKSVELEGGSLQQTKKILLKDSNINSNAGGPFKPKVVISGRIDATDEDEIDENEKFMSVRPLSRKEITTIIMDKLAVADEAENDINRQSVNSDSDTTIFRRTSVMAYPIRQLELSKISTQVVEEEQEAPTNTRSRGESHGFSQKQLLAAEQQSPDVKEPTDEVPSVDHEPTTTAVVEASTVAQVPIVEDPTPTAEPAVQEATESPPDTNSSANDTEPHPNREDP